MSFRSSSPLLIEDSLENAARSAVEREHVATKPRSRSVARRWRLPLLVAALLALWIALLGWAARAPLHVVLQPEQRLRYEGSEFRVVMGAGVSIENDRRLSINAVGAEHMALQSRVLARPIDAKSFPILRYRWDDFPRTLELSFVFRREDQAGDVHTVTLPPAAAHPGYFDLSDVPDWRGRIIEIGFAEFPTAQLVPADIAFRPFALLEAELWSSSWRGSLGALGTDWSAYRPWALMSVSALGPDAPWPHKPTPVLVLSIGLTASVVVAGFLFARHRRWFGVTLCLALAAGWIALDLRWLGELADRHALTRQLFAGKPWRERATIEPDTALMDVAARVRAWLARQPASLHVLVAAPAVYDVLRLDYHLLPSNVAPVDTMSLAPAVAAARSALLVVYADPAYAFDATHKRLRAAQNDYSADLVFDEGDVRIFRLREGAP